MSGAPLTELKDGNDITNHNRDAFGRTRTTRTRGAFEYFSGEPDSAPQAPTNLRAQ